MLIYTAYVTPYEVAFLQTKFDPMFIVNQVVNISFLLDMFKTFMTAYLDREHSTLQGNPWKIAKAYFKSWFWVDLVSILPFDSVGLATGSAALQKAKDALAKATAIREKEAAAFHASEVDHVQAIENLKASELKKLPFPEVERLVRRGWLLAFICI